MDQQIEAAESWYVNQQQQNLPVLRCRLLELEKLIASLDDGNIPLYKIKAQQVKLERELVRTRAEIDKFTNNALLQTFKAETRPIVENAKIKKRKTDNQQIQKKKRRGRKKKNPEPDQQTDVEEPIEDAPVDPEIDMDEAHGHKRDLEYQRLLRDLNLHEEEEQVSDLEMNKRKHLCKNCHIPMFCLPSSSKLVCQQCSLTQDFIDTSALTTSFNTESDFQNNYQRSTHLAAILSVFRYQVFVDIPQEVYDGIKKLYSQYRYPYTRYITPAKINSALQHLGYIHLYKHKHQITMKVNNKEWPMTMTEQQLLEVVFLFLKMQAPYEAIKNRPNAFGFNDAQRSSFLKYELCAFHSLKLLGYDEFCPHLKLLQVPQRHRTQLSLFQAVCREMSINYIPTLR